MSIHVSTDNRSLLRYRKSANIRLQLFCFPFAGASASVFRPWIDKLPDGIEILAVQLPGRENRHREPCVNEMTDIVQDLEADIGESIEAPFAFFGHSLGSLIAYELLQRFAKTGRASAELFFASGGPAPHTLIGPTEPRKLTQEQILTDLRRISGTHSGLLNDPEVLALLLPMLQADFEIYANYHYAEQSPLPCPIVAIRGAGDTYISHLSQTEWKKHTDRHFSFHVVPGKHLFMVDSSAALLSVVTTWLTSILNKYSRRGLPVIYSA